jgi:hypothetical protein
MMSVLSNYLLLAFVVVSTLYHHQQGWPPQKGGGLAFGAALPEIDEIESGGAKICPF